MSLLQDFWHNFSHNLFKPLLLFFYLGFSIPLLRVSFEFPYVIYQGLTMYLLIAIGWHGGEELAQLSAGSMREAVGFMALGFVTNLIIGVVAYFALRKLVRLRKIDAATVAGYYGSDSAGTFVTCVGVLTAVGVAYAPYMPVMLAIMEIPGCLVALFLVSRLRRDGLDALGNAWDEPGYNPAALAEHPVAVEHHATNDHAGHGTTTSRHAVGRHAALAGRHTGRPEMDDGQGSVAVAELDGNDPDDGDDLDAAAMQAQSGGLTESELALEEIEGQDDNQPPKQAGFLNPKLLHEVFLNPGIVLLFGGILIGFISRLQGEQVTKADDSLFVTLFQGVLCLFLLEMGITASRRLRDLGKAGWKFVLFGILAPNVFATFGILVAHTYSLATGAHLELGTYVLFAVLCGAASYIAVPAVQRLAIPEASPTLPLAASLGLTFTYNVTVGIPVYMLISKALMMASGTA